MRQNLFQSRNFQQHHFEAALEEALALKNVTDDRKHGEKTQKKKAYQWNVVGLKSNMGL